MKPPFRWTGSKARLAPRLLETIGDREGVWVEPFAGGAAMFFAREKEGAVLNDVSPAVATVLKIIATEPIGLEDDLGRLRIEQANVGHEEFYGELKRRFNALDWTIAKRRHAALFVALNQTCFNGLWRVNSKDQFNVPIGRKSDGSFYDIVATDFSEHSRLLSSCIITCKDFVDVKVSSGSIVYCDPPYLDQYSSYAKNGFGRKEHELLLAWGKVTSRNSKVWISASDTEETRSLYGEPFATFGRANTNGVGKRERTTELLYAIE